MQTLPKFPRNWSTNFTIFVEFVKILHGQRSYFPIMIHVVYPKGQQEEYKTTLHQLSLVGNIDSIDGILSYSLSTYHQIC